MMQKKIGFACGVFDLFHAGHVLMFMECKEHCEYLIVGVNRASNFDARINPGKEAPVYSADDRKLLVSSCRFVDEAVFYEGEDELLELLRSRKIDVRFLGEDYRGKPITGEGLVREIHYTDRGHGLSSSHFKKLIRGKAIR